MVVYTCVLGETDPLRIPTVREEGVRYICFTDNRTLIAQRDGGPWKMVYVKPEGDTKLQSRKLKILAHRYIPYASLSLWLDAAYELHTPFRDLISLVQGSDIVAMKHPHRQRIKDEAEAIIRLGLAPEAKVRGQLAAYQAAGFDTDEHPQQAITSTGFLIRRHIPIVKEWECRWWHEVLAHTYRDQMSIDFVLEQIRDLRVAYLPGHYKNNPYAKWHTDPHNARHPHLRSPRSVPIVRTVDQAAIMHARRMDRERRREAACGLPPRSNAFASSSAIRAAKLHP